MNQLKKLLLFFVQTNRRATFPYRLSIILISYCITVIVREKLVTVLSSRFKDKFYNPIDFGVC